MVAQVTIPQLPPASAGSSGDLYPVAQGGTARKQTLAQFTLAQDALRSAAVQQMLQASNAENARTALGLGNVNNTSDLSKPVSVAQQAALDLKADAAQVGKVTDHFLTNASEGIPVDLVTPASAALIAAEQKAYDTGAVLELSGDYLIDADVEFRRPFRTNGTVRFWAIAAGDTVPTRTVRFSRRFAVEGVTFDYLNVLFSPSTGSQRVSQAAIKRNVFHNSPVVVGQALVPTFGFELRDNDHVWGLSRLVDAVTLINVSLSSIAGRMQSFRRAVNITVTRSFACEGVKVGAIEATNCFEGIRGEGNSMCRITNLELDGCVISSSARDTPLITSGCIVLTWTDGLRLKGVKATGNGDVVKLQACRDISIDAECRLESTGNLGACIRVSGCPGGRIIGASLRSNTGYLILIGPATLNPITTGNIYSSRNWLVQGVEGLCDALGISFQDTANARAFSNRVTSRIAAPNGLIRFNAGCTGQYYDNTLSAPSGLGVQNLAGSAVTQGISNDALVVSALPAPVINAPVITASDSDLDGAKSYVVQFTLGHYTQLRQLADDTAPKTLSNWMAGVVASKTLAWNSAAWNAAGNQHIGDIVVNGITYDNFGPEDWWTMPSMVVIDRQNRLTCRNWASTEPVSLNVPVGVSARQITEQAWQTASFRSPLVVDGAVYDPIPSGLATANDFSVVRSGRMSIGQKMDGTYVLLAVDGQTGVSGTTQAKVAAKLVALGCQNAFNLDGGGSATLWYNGAIINTPSDPGGERAIPACMYV